MARKKSKTNYDRGYGRCVLECGRWAFYKESRLCNTCYQRIHYQLKRGVTWITKRMRQIGSWQNGLDHVLREKGLVPAPRRGRKSA